MSTPEATPEFEVLGPRKRAVNVGDVFAWKLTTSDVSYAGQVLDVETEWAGAKLLLVLFFDVVADEIRSGARHLEVGRMIECPFITNRTGWYDGLFVTITNQPWVDVGCVGLRKFSGEFVDLRGDSADRLDFDLIIPDFLSPPGAIAPQLLPRRG